jgi:hypothetical protein
MCWTGNLGWEDKEYIYNFLGKFHLEDQEGLWERNINVGNALWELEVDRTCSRPHPVVVCNISCVETSGTSIKKLTDY